MTVSISTKVPKVVKDNYTAVAKAYGLSRGVLISDLIKNSTPQNTVPDEFLVRSRVADLIKVDAPINTVIPYTASALGLKFHDYTVKDRTGREYKITPFPDHGKLFIILMVEALYDIYRRLK